MKLHAAKVSEFDWKKSVKNQINSIRDSFSMGAFTWALEKKKKKFVEVLSGNQMSCPFQPFDFTTSYFETNKGDRPRKTNVNWQITSAHCLSFYTVCTGDKVKLKVNVIWCLSISRSLVSRYLFVVIVFFILAFGFFYSPKKISHNTLILWFKMNLR